MASDWQLQTEILTNRETANIGLNLVQLVEADTTVYVNLEVLGSSPAPVNLSLFEP